MNPTILYHLTESIIDQLHNVIAIQRKWNNANLPMQKSQKNIILYLKNKNITSGLNIPVKDSSIMVKRGYFFQKYFLGLQKPKCWKETLQK